MRRCGLKAKVLSLCLSLFATEGARSAILIEPAGPFLDFPLEGVTVAGEPTISGIIVEDVRTPFRVEVDNESLSGHVQNRVVRSGETGTLSFYWRVILSDVRQNQGDIIAFRLGGFQGMPLMDAGWRKDSPGLAAPYAIRYFGSSTGTINFLFDEGELSGHRSSRFFYLRTSAVAYDSSGVFDLLCGDSDCQSAVFSTFAPAQTPVPLAP